MPAPSNHFFVPTPQTSKTSESTPQKTPVNLQKRILKKIDFTQGGMWTLKICYFRRSVSASVATFTALSLQSGTPRPKTKARTIFLMDGARGFVSWNCDLTRPYASKSPRTTPAIFSSPISSKLIWQFYRAYRAVYHCITCLAIWPVLTPQNRQKRSKIQKNRSSSKPRKS